MVKAGLDTQHYWLVGCALFVGVLTLYSMTKIWAEAFWKKAPPAGKEQKAASSDSLPKVMVIPCVGLALITVWLSLNPEPLLELSTKASEQLTNPQGYIQAVLGQ